ncbi:MAG: U32 family peptidase [Candidatus Margulisiibacteriota bacterium]|nr:MAG: hypothetical protein A2X43_06975 [Candidatus Margulisbacteria bacterium GWD2_39_127]PZM78770.1 MAG: U32 family peptidase [Candidatus Margulisiibacteriota bacterium]HAR63328.1 peptidase U32 [Candidatus Margulisiibacteriota bacterium]HCY36449.1 peptidase U32 [Candidatus Margulisiibacteriota bacterium]
MSARLELLAPAGNLEKLKTAVQYGADAVYVGAPGLSLRTRASEMDFEQIKEGVAFAHQHGVKVYAALNIFPQNSDLALIEETIPRLVNKKIDAIVVSDPGVIALVKKVAPTMDIHLSTQANTTNIEAVRFWAKNGIKRIVLARELSINEIAQIAQNVKNVEIEVFAHGAMCIAYSGRCILSSYMASRPSNKGECSHPCRWEYYLKEATRKEPLVIEEDEHGTYIMNSKDLCLIEHLPLIIESNIGSIKIEGRMKSAYYVALVTKIYRKAIDEYMKDPDNYVCKPEWIAELQNVSYRGYSTGFYFGAPGPQDHNYLTSGYIKNYDFVGMVEEYYPHKNMIKIAVRNHILAQDELEILLPKADDQYIIKPNSIKDFNGNNIGVAHNTNEVFVSVTHEVPVGSIVRRKAREK